MYLYDKAKTLCIMVIIMAQNFSEKFQKSRENASLAWMVLDEMDEMDGDGVDGHGWRRWAWMAWMDADGLG
ncbi:CLUMA_CG016134, isoform A [Clunio marinus]|uniref:CLUMA_CG016134, isoform A n=1 Tax=Clunio marinus TaxID=568069 RepID=A0A1J1IRK0_9DIPT|nr:CLUMA_CG016134, isoform A [Clunio marinus]